MNEGEKRMRKVIKEGKEWKPWREEKTIKGDEMKKGKEIEQCGKKKEKIT